MNQSCCYTWINTNTAKPNYGERVAVTDGKIVDFAYYVNDPVYGPVYLSDDGYLWEVTNSTSVLYWSKEPELPPRAINATMLRGWLIDKIEESKSENDKSIYRSVLTYVDSMPTIGIVVDPVDKAIVGTAVVGKSIVY